uniref:Magnesium-dependent phosphatase 1 n=1 Tax=Cacopsylla melanoneura TaxID=428564 RepID=A0A8D8MHB2_9HEMI
MTADKEFPKMIVFGLDHTLWPFKVHVNYVSPFNKVQDEIRDSHGKLVSYYPEVPEILSFLKKHSSNVKIGIASLSKDRTGANQLLDLLGWGQYIDYREIFESKHKEKKSHFLNLHKHSGIDYEDMLFFDDQWKNNIEPAYLNVTCWWVINGLNKIKLNKGLVNWNECHKILQNPKFEISDFKKAENLI